MRRRIPGADSWNVRVKHRPKCGAKTRAGGSCLVSIEYGRTRCMVSWWPLDRSEDSRRSRSDSRSAKTTLAGIPAEVEPKCWFGAYRPMIGSRWRIDFPNSLLVRRWVQGSGARTQAAEVARNRPVCPIGATHSSVSFPVRARDLYARGLVNRSGVLRPVRASARARVMGYYWERRGRGSRAPVGPTAARMRCQDKTGGSCRVVAAPPIAERVTRDHVAGG
jgi:hypothetical protein